MSRSIPATIGLVDLLTLLFICPFSYPNYYVASRPLEGSLRHSGEPLGVNLLSPRRLLITSVDYLRAFMIEEAYRRLKAVFSEEDGPFDAKEEVS